MSKSVYIKQAFEAALPIMLGYVAIGIPCGILNASIGLNVLQVFLLSVLFYSGAGQFMLPNMYLAGAPLASIIASISLVNSRQMLYSASFAPFCDKERKRLTFLFGATVTDESFGVNTEKFEEGNWSVKHALWVNIFSCASWTVSNSLGVIIGGLINIPLAVASFAMTSIFVCLMCSQKICIENIVAIIFAIVGVYVCKCIGLTGPAILLGAIIGVAAAFAASILKEKASNKTAKVSSSDVAPNAKSVKASVNQDASLNGTLSAPVCSSEMGK